MRAACAWQVEFGAGGKPTVLLFWAKYAKGEVRVTAAVSDLVEKYAGRVNVVGVSVDLAKKDAEKFLASVGEENPEQRSVIKASFAAAYDTDKELLNAFKEVAETDNLGPSSVFLVNADGVIVWRERFSSSHEWKDGIFEQQLDRLLDGKELISVGKAPATEEVVEEEEGGGDDVDLF